MTSSSGDDGGYVHDPSAFDEDGARRDDDSGESATEAEAEAGTGTAETDTEESVDWVNDPIHPTGTDREFDWRGWVLVGVVIFAFVIAPVTIILLPPADYLFALIILPLVPAVILAITAVWATTRP